MSGAITGDMISIIDLSTDAIVNAALLIKAADIRWIIISEEEYGRIL